LPKLAVLDHLTRNARAELKEKRTEKPFSSSHVQQGEDSTFRPLATGRGKHLKPKAMGKVIIHFAWIFDSSGDHVCINRDVNALGFSFIL
jgi:hypothetical protein